MNAKAATTVIPAYLCPSATNSSNTYQVVNAGGTVLAPAFSRSNYVANAGRVEVWDGAAVLAAGADLSSLADGPFYRNSHTQIRDVTDGLSNTVFFGEQTPYHSNSTWVGIVPDSVTCPSSHFPLPPCDAAAPQINVHSGPGGPDETTPIIHPPNNSAGNVDEM